MITRLRNPLLGHPYVVALCAIAVATGLFVLGRPYFAKGQWALLYLLIVALIARAGGAGPALLAAALSFIAWNFFLLPPYHTLLVADSKDWLALAALLLVGLVVGIQTGRLRDREARAIARERESTLLARLSANLVSEVSVEAMGRVVVDEVSRLMRPTRVMLFVPDDGGDCRLLASSPDGVPPLDREYDTADWVFAHGSPVNLPPSALQIAGSVETSPPAHSLPAPATTLDDDSIYLPLQTVGQAQGVLVLGPAPDGRSYTATDLRMAVSVANLVAAFLDRQRLTEQAARADAEREADLLKSSLLSSVSHELKTPLAALTATVSNLLEGDTEWDEETMREELRSIVTDVARLSSSINSLLDLSRLEARAWKPHKDWYDVQDILQAALDSLPAHLRDRVTIDVPAELRPLQADYVQLCRVLQNVLENALFYSGDGPVIVGARETADVMEIWVEDRGPGVRPDERELIFEKFYRGTETSVARPSGTGLGLAIAREIILAHGGRLTVEDAQPHGARFVVELPRATESDAAS